MSTKLAPKKLEKVERDVFQNKLFSADISQFGDTPTEVVPVYDLRVGRTIGSGGFGIVFSALDPSTNQCFAIKKMKYEVLDPKSELTAKKELEFARRFKHKNIPKVYGTYTSKNSAYIVMGLCKVGSLKHYIKTHFPIEIRLMKLFTKDMVSAVRYLHLQNIAHQDIKLTNAKISQIKYCKKKLK